MDTARETRPVVDLRAKMAGAEERVVRVRDTTYLIGRDAACQLRPASPFVSRKHAELTIADGVVTLRDLDSSNGTYVNGAAITVPTPLFDGDRVEIGPLSFTVEIQSPVAHVQTSADQTEDVVASWLLVDDDEPPAGTVRPAPRPGSKAQPAVPPTPGEFTAAPAPPIFDQPSTI